MTKAFLPICHFDFQVKPKKKSGYILKDMKRSYACPFLIISFTQNYTDIWIGKLQSWKDYIKIKNGIKDFKDGGLQEMNERA